MHYLTAEELKKSHQKEAHSVLRGHIGKNIQNEFASRLLQRYAQTAFGGKTDIKILDLGSASGFFAKQLTELGYGDVSGIDLEDYRSSENKAIFKDFKTADLSSEAIPWPDGSFQAVTAWCVLPHLENPFRAFREIRRVMSPKGLFIFSAPNLASKASMSYFLKNQDFGSYHSGNNHIAILTKGIIEKTVLKYFDLVNIEYHIRQKTFSRGWRGKARKMIYLAASAISPKLKKGLEKRWAYNAIYVLKPKV